MNNKKYRSSSEWQKIFKTLGLEIIKLKDGRNYVLIYNPKNDDNILMPSKGNVSLDAFNKMLKRLRY